MTISTITLVAFILSAAAPLCILAYWHGRERHQRAVNEQMRLQNEDYVRWLMEPYVSVAGPREIERQR